MIQYLNIPIIPGRQCQIHSGNFRNSLSRIFGKKYRENNSFTKEITKDMIWRNIFSVRVNFSLYHTVRLISLEFYVKTWKKTHDEFIFWQVFD